ncbi:hypothetical protein BLA29_002609 [Euroglyphus maynei]|uniref:Lipid-binding serum glycoprotein C-terminal domain-containing protein n=1 Tax=Euroglyphus maynei TaxID=6958 RepID=A0A1Y3AVR9_EURMA|nr:hypothetical protein BLA29_002609 [Euroglyphus maynei]
MMSLTKVRSIFSYSVNGRDPIKTIRDFALETDEVKMLEERFIDHFTETILSKLANEMKSGVPSMSIPPLDPLRLDEIKVEPHIGNEIFTIKLNNIQVEGLSDLDIQDIRPKLNVLKVRFALLFPKMTASCHFKVNGTIYNVINVNGEGDGKLEYDDVLVRTQLNLVHENKTFRIASCDPPLIDFNTAKIVLSNHNDTGIASELGPLLFWVLADHVVQEIDQYLLKYVNNNMLLFKVPESFNPAVTWLLNRSSSQSSSSSSQQIPPILSPFPILNHWINSLSNNLNRPHIHTKFFKK